jgi:putative alpha-1,2-mannosidase
MAFLLSAAAVHKIYPLSKYGGIFLIMTYVLHLLSLNPPIVGSFHNNAGVLQYVNPKIGTYGVLPNQNGGMIPSVSPPFGMTRWTPQTREV